VKSSYLHIVDLGWYLGFDLDHGSLLMYHALHQPPLLLKDLTSNPKGKSLMLSVAEIAISLGSWSFYAFSLTF